MDKFKDSMRNILNFHKRSKYAEEETNQATSAKSKMVPKKKKKGFSLPYWWVYIGWFGKYIISIAPVMLMMDILKKLIEYMFFLNKYRAICERSNLFSLHPDYLGLCFLHRAVLDGVGSREVP